MFRAMDAREELTQELKKARGWILGVGIVMFVVDMFMIHVVQKDLIPDSWKTRLLILDLVVLGYFVTLWWFAKTYPKACCILALVGFWGLHIGIAVWANNFESLFKNGIIMKILFTVALINGIKSGSRAQQLQDELGKVFS